MSVNVTEVYKDYNNKWFFDGIESIGKTIIAVEAKTRGCGGCDLLSFENFKCTDCVNCESKTRTDKTNVHFKIVNIDSSVNKFDDKLTEILDDFNITNEFLQGYVTFNRKTRG